MHTTVDRIMIIATLENMNSELTCSASKKKLSSTKMPRAFFAELFLAMFAEHVELASIFASVAINILYTVAPYFGVNIEYVPKSVLTK